MKEQGYYHPEVIERRQRMQEELQKAGVLKIDRACFIKTPEEKLALKIAKKQYKAKLKIYGEF